MQLNKYNTIYFLGIGGIGMSALARWFKYLGYRVVGYDRTNSPLTKQLVEEGIEIHFEDRIDLMPSKINKENTLVVYTPAIHRKHKEFIYLKNNEYTILKRSELLGLITKEYKTVAVAGTHGKTTTSSLIAHILKSANMNMVAFLGGIITNYDSNLVMEGELGSKTVVVAEADEFDRSFLKLFPSIAVITSMDADHLDIYKDHESLIQSFKSFAGRVKPKGHLIVHESIESVTQGLTKLSVNTYGMSRGQFFTGQITTEGGFFEFNLLGKGLKIERIMLGVPGFHNMENAIAAVIVSLELGITPGKIKESLASFKGVKRRFEFIIRRKNLVYIDDYAHHPTEIEVFLKSLQSMYSGKKITVIFQPHLYTRTRDFAKYFSKSLSLANEVLLMDIYPAREEPIPGVDSDMIFKEITSSVKIRCNKNDVLKKLDSLDIEVLATIGAGDIDTCVTPIKEHLSQKYHEV